DIPYVDKDWTNVSMPSYDKSDFQGDFPRQGLKLS
ncbi:MAG: hypothetical protein RLZZ361_1255, partial [Cyanobacteriota bacterium]